jgi:hypothetical protein
VNCKIARITKRIELNRSLAVILTIGGEAAEVSTRETWRGLIRGKVEYNDDDDVDNVDGCGVALAVGFLASRGDVVDNEEDLECVGNYAIDNS